MIWLLVAIFSAGSLFVQFKLWERYAVNNFPAIVINYIVAFLIGLVIIWPEYTWQEAWDSEAVHIAVKPFCGQRKNSFKGQSKDAIAFLRPYAELVVSREQVENLFPTEFAGSLHQLEALLAKMVDLKDLVESLKDWTNI